MKQIFLILVIATIALAGCEKSFENFSPNPGSATTDTVWASSAGGNFTNVNTLHENLARAPLQDSLNLQAGGVVEFPDNIRIEIPANAFTLNGIVTDGKAQVVFTLLKTKGDFIKFRKPTTSNGYLLESGGCYNLQLFKGGQPLALVPGKLIKVTYKDLNPNPLMTGFAAPGTITGTGSSSFNWVKDDSLYVRAVLGTGYEIYQNKLNWINCDYFKDTAEVKTRIAFILPAQFTNTNTSSFVAYKSIRSVMQMDADATNRIWRKDKVPVNRQVTYVTITKMGDDYFLGTKESTTTINQNVEIRPEKKSIQEIKNFLDAL
ncbi:MAG: hypothetical protein ABIX01_14060 [Chitinophagaceae bacterium]